MFKTEYYDPLYMQHICERTFDFMWWSCIEKNNRTRDRENIYCISIQVTASNTVTIFVIHFKNVVEKILKIINHKTDNNAIEMTAMKSRWVNTVKTLAVTFLHLFDHWKLYMFAIYSWICLTSSINPDLFIWLVLVPHGGGVRLYIIGCPLISSNSLLVTH